MTPSNGNIFRVTTGYRWIPRTKASDAGFDVLFDVRLNQRLSKQSCGWWFETPSNSWYGIKLLAAKMYKILYYFHLDNVFFIRNRDKIGKIIKTEILSQKPLRMHYDDVIMSAIASRIARLPTVYLIVYSRADQRKHQSSASLAFVRGIHRRPVNSQHKGPVTRKMVPFDDVIMVTARTCDCHDDYLGCSLWTRASHSHRTRSVNNAELWWVLCC